MEVINKPKMVRLVEPIKLEVREMTLEEAKNLVARRDDVVQELVTSDRSVLCQEMGKLPGVNSEINWGVGFWRNPDRSLGAKGVVFDILRLESRFLDNRDGLVAGFGGWGSTPTCVDWLLAEILEKAGSRGWHGLGITASPIGSDWTLSDPRKFKDMEVSRKLVYGLVEYLRGELGVEAKYLFGHSMWGHGAARIWADLIKGILPLRIADLFKNTKFMAIAGVAESGPHVTLTQDMLIKTILAFDPKRRLLAIDRGLLHGMIAEAKFTHFLEEAADFPIILASHLHTFNKMPGLAEFQTDILDRTMKKMIGGQTMQMIRRNINPMTLVCMMQDRVLTFSEQQKIADEALRMWEIQRSPKGAEVIKAISFKSGHYWNQEAKVEIAEQVAKDLISGKT